MREFPLNIKGPRVELRTLEPTFENAKMLFDNVDANRGHMLPWLDWVIDTNSPEDEFWVLGKWDKNRRNGKSYEYGIFLGGEHIGQIGAFDLDDTSKSCEIGYWIAKRAQGKGIISEALKLLEAELFAYDGCERVQIKCDTRNERSASVAQRAGYKFEGTLRHARFSKSENKFADSYLFAKIRGD